MNLGGDLSMLTSALRARGELRMKEDIQLAARAFGRFTQSDWFPSGAPIMNGDDAAALPSDDGYVLFAAEGMRPEFVAEDPWFAGYSAVMVNLSDIAAMGGRPWAVVDALFLGEGQNEQVLEGMAAASLAFGVPVVGGHTARVAGPTLLAVAILGRAKRLISSAQARPGQVLVAAIDLRGEFRGRGGNFDAATSASSQRLRAALSVLPELAEAELVDAGKDISMAGLCGTALMLLEASGCGATLDLERVPAPPGVEPLRWLTAFPSYGFLLSIDEDAVASVSARFDAIGVACAAVGTLNDSGRLELACRGNTELYWDLARDALTGFAAADPRSFYA